MPLSIVDSTKGSNAQGQQQERQEREGKMDARFDTQIKKYDEEVIILHKNSNKVFLTPVDFTTRKQAYYYLKERNFNTDEFVIYLLKNKFFHITPEGLFRVRY